MAKRMPPIAVLICGPIKPPIGGVSIHIARLIERLSSTSDFRFTLCDESRIVKDDIFNIRSLRLLQYLGLIWHSQLVHVQSGVSVARALHIVFARLLGKRVVVTIHSWTHGRVPTLIWKSVFLLFRPELIYVSEAIANKFGNSGRIIPAFIPPNIAMEPDLPDSLILWIDAQRAAGKPIICSNASRLATLKGEDVYGLDLCIEALARLGSHCVALVFVISEPNYDPEKLRTARERIESLHLESDIYLQEGAVSFVRVIEKSDITLRATITDGDALSIRESLALGKPTLASDVVKRPEGTILYATRDCEDLCGKIREAIFGLKSSPGDVPVPERGSICADEIKDIYLNIATDANRLTQTIDA